MAQAFVITGGTKIYKLAGFGIGYDAIWGRREKVGIAFAGFGFLLSRYEKVVEISLGIENLPIANVLGAKQI